MTQKQTGLQPTSAALHLLAMLFMLLDHTWASFPGAGSWMTCVGRLAFPLFAFLLVEGFFHTHDLKSYLKRLIFFALLSEIPFDLMYEGTALNPFHQNVLWTFLIALLGMSLMERARQRFSLWVTVLVDLGIVLGTFLLGILSFADYNGPGILTVYVFYFFRERKAWHFAGQFLLLGIIHLKLISGYFYTVSLFGLEWELSRQGFALLALPIIWCYRGKQGYHAKWFQYFCYAFYPVHALILYLIPLFLR